MSATHLNPSRSCKRQRASGFSLVELLVVLAVIGILAGILLPTLAKSRSRAQTIICLNNTRQLTLAWMMYSEDHSGLLAYNLGSPKWGQPSSASQSMSLNWADNILDWHVRNSDNTNAAKMVKSGLGPYAGRMSSIYHCPADFVLSRAQQEAGWHERVRSYSMNAMVGDAGGISADGHNVNNPEDTQFFTLDMIPEPSQIFVFLDEHPDTISDGYFLDRENRPEWERLPASYHDGGACFSFADGHSEIHHWRYTLTRPPSVPHGAEPRPIPIPANQRDDFNWVMAHMSVERQASPVAE